MLGLLTGTCASIYFRFKTLLNCQQLPRIFRVHSKWHLKYTVLSVVSLFLAGDPLLFKETMQDFKPVSKGKPMLNKSSTRRFHIYGSDSVLNQKIAMLCEDVASGVERYLSLQVPAGPGVFKVFLHSDEEVDSGRCITAAEMADNKVCYTIRLVNVDGIEDVDLIRCLVRQLLNCLIYSHIPQDRVGNMRIDLKGVLLRDLAPSYIVEGLLGNILPGARAQAAADVLVRWRDGNLSDLDRLLALPLNSTGTNIVSDVSADQAVSTLFLDWIKGWDRSGVILQRLTAVYANKSFVTTEDIRMLNPKFKGWQDLVLEWDKYLLGRRRSVLNPGSFDRESMDNFRNQLVIYPGLTGIPAEDMKGRECLFLSDIIPLKNKDWVKDFAESKRVSLCLISAGRGAEMQDLAEVYGEFFESLGNRARDSKLRKLLALAEAKLKKISDSLEKE